MTCAHDMCIKCSVKSIHETDQTVVKSARSGGVFSAFDMSKSVNSFLNIVNWSGTKMEEEPLESRCAHLIFHGDDVIGLQWLLQGLTGAELCEFPTKLIPTTDRTLLMACAKQGRPSCCKLLLSLDSAASVNYQNAQGYTALHYASYQGHIEVAFLLLAAGADWRILNTHGESAYQTAISGKKFELVNRYQVSPYFADNYYAPASNVIMSRHDAAQYKLEIINVDSGGDRKLIGLDFYCLATTQRTINSAPVSDLSGSACEASGSIHYGSDDLYIGRARSNHVCLNDLSLSKQHAVICYIENMGFVAYDIGSKHGTFVNKERLPVGTDVYTTKDNNTNCTALHTIGGTATSTSSAEAPVKSEEDTDGASHSIATPQDATIASTSTALNTTSTAAPASSTPLPTMLLPTYLVEGMLVQFGRVHCKVVRKKQEAVLTGRFQPTTTVTKSGSDSALHQHHLAVQQRVRALLNVPDEVVVNTAGQAARSSISKGGGGSSSGAGTKRKLDAAVANVPRKVVHTAPPSLPSHKTQDVFPPAVYTALPHTDLNTANKGMQLLQKYGWEQGIAIGKSGDKANEPIKVSRMVDRAGIGCNTNDALSTANSGTAMHIIDDELDSEKTKAWKRMMARFAEPR